MTNEVIQPLINMFKTALKDKSAVVAKADGSFIDFTIGDVKYRTYRTHEDQLELFAIVFPNDIIVTDCLTYADELVKEQRQSSKLEQIKELEAKLKELKNEE